MLFSCVSCCYTTLIALFFPQQANRHFNRGIFHLDTSAASRTKDAGYNDLLKSKQYDTEACELKGGWNKEHDVVSDFKILLCRVEGLSAIIRIPDVEDVWGVDELIDKAESLLQVECEKDDSPLFKAISCVGRLQQLECSKIWVLTARGDKEEALRIAVRMIAEDEYILSTVLPTIASCLFDHLIALGAEEIQSPRKACSASQVWNALATMGFSLENVNLNGSTVSAKNVFFCLDFSGSMNSRFVSRSTGTVSTRILSANQNLLKIFDDHVDSKDFVGFLRFNHFVDAGLRFDLTQKSQEEGYLRSLLARATDAGGGTRMYKAISDCVDKITASDSWFYKTFIIALTDGISNDEPDEVQRKIEALNKDRRYRIHVIIVGVEVPGSVVNTCKRLCTLSDKSAYIDSRGGLDAMDEAFEQVAAMISGGGTTMENL